MDYELTSSSAEVSAAEKRQALAAALASRTFSRTLQLRKLLAFLCENELEGRSGTLSESVIAVEVFHRPSDYSGAEDSYVRTRVYELRQKLDKLYKHELRDTPVRVTLPKGAYVPVFERSLPPAYHWTPAPSAHARIPWLWVVAAAVAGALLTVLIVGAINSPRYRVDPVVLEAWGRFASPNANPVLCIATPLHMIAGPADYEGPKLAAYPLPKEAYVRFGEHRPLAEGQQLGLTITDTSVALGILNAVVATSNLLISLHEPFQILPEKLASLSTLRKRNAIIFGTPFNSEAMTTLLTKAPLTIAYDEGVREFVIINRQPANGLPLRLAARKDEMGAFTEAYGLVTVLQTDASEGKVGRLLFTGITSVGTHGAVEFFTSAPHLKNLKSRLQQHGIPTFPPSYQVLVKCSLNRLSLLGYEFAGYAVLSN